MGFRYNLKPSVEIEKDLYEHAEENNVRVFHSKAVYKVNTFGEVLIALKFPTQPLNFITVPYVTVFHGLDELFAVTKQGRIDFTKL